MRVALTKRASLLLAVIVLASTACGRLSSGGEAEPQAAPGTSISPSPRGFPPISCHDGKTREEHVHYYADREGGVLVEVFNEDSYQYSFRFGHRLSYTMGYVVHPKSHRILRLDLDAGKRPGYAKEAVVGCQAIGPGAPDHEVDWQYISIYPPYPAPSPAPTST